MANIIHVVGTAGLGETLVCLLADFARDLGIGEVTFHRRSASEADRPRLKALLDKGAVLAAEGETRSELERMGLEVPHTPVAALERATVVVDATPGASRLRDVYAGLRSARGVVALQADGAFGPAVAHGVNVAALRKGTDRLVRVAGSGAHGMALVTAALAGTTGSRVASALEGRFVFLPRTADVALGSDLPSAALGPHPDMDAGTADAALARQLLAGIGADCPVFGSTMELNHALLHTLHFAVRLRERITAADALARLQEHARAARTEKLSPNPVFGFGRDHGWSGRLLNPLVVPRPSLAVRPEGEVVGFAYLPPEGNELMSAVAAVLWLMDGEPALRRMDAFKPYAFDEV
ncbi:MAG: hypothetical protein HY904_12660 [Deltaproteobacteria bacterium]|nr:hypothetical protein [Deltaproteobacteria bacterium]